MDSNIQLKIETLAFGGAGVGRKDGIVYFVPFAVPGDIVEVRIVARHKRFMDACIHRIVEKSPHRVEPICKFFGVCGGCDWMNVDYGVQLQTKEAIVRFHIEKFGGIRDPKILPIIYGQPLYYRTRANVHRASSKIGFYKKHSHEIVDIDVCHLLDKSLDIRNLEPESVFSQVNPTINEKLIQELLKHGDFIGCDVLELYAGSGNFTRPISEIGASIHAVEQNAEAVEAAKPLKIVKNHVSRELRLLVTRGQTFDRVIVDPPRMGLFPEMPEMIAKLCPEKILYVSCNPSTLGRDIARFEKCGYHFQLAQPFDMFPQTTHVETLAILTKPT